MSYTNRSSFGRPIETQLSLLNRGKIVVPIGMILSLVSFLSLVGVESQLVFGSTAISCGLCISLLGVAAFFWFAIPYVTPQFKPNELYHNYLYQEGHYFNT